MRTIAIINQKGGCGKTTTAINLAGILARFGRRTLLVDMDPQSHCAAGLGVPEHRIDLDIGDAMLGVGERPIDAGRLLWCTGRHLDLAPSRMKLAGLEAPQGGLADLPDKERRLARVLESFSSQYEVAVIDCSPAIGLLTYNALAAADMVLIPVETSFFSLQGATRQVNTVRAVAKRLGLSRSAWLLPTIHDEASAVARDLLLELKRRFKDRLAPVVIRRDVNLREAASFGQAIVDYAPASPGAEDYTRLAEWALDALTVLRVESATFDDADAPTIEVMARDAGDVMPRRASAMAELAASLSAGKAAPPASTPAPGEEVKPMMSRAEDVARRAQQFLRRALGVTPTKGGPTASMSGEPRVGECSPINPGAVSAGDPTPRAGGGPRWVEGPKGGHTTLRVAESLEAKPDPSRPASSQVEHLLGVRSTRQGVLFVQPAKLGGRVFVAGDFNNWDPQATPMQLNNELGVFEACLKLPAGRHRYRLVVDGRWQADPHNHHSEPNGMGDSNNLIDVEGAA